MAIVCNKECCDLFSFKGPEGMVQRCKTLNRNVSASVFGNNSPRDCPRREENKKVSSFEANTGLDNLNIGCKCHVETVNDAWSYWYENLASQAKNGVSEESRDGTVVGEYINAITVIDDPTKNIVTSDIRKLPMRYAIGEFLWYMAEDNTIKGIRPFTKAWDRMSDDGEIINSNYGHKIGKFYGFDQMKYVEKLLQKDPNTRQAVIHIKDPRDTIKEPTKDVPCTVCLQFLLRDNKLHMTVYMRSNDIWMGFPYDVFNFTNMQIMLAMRLGVDIGTYTHVAGSLHLYQRNLVEIGGSDD